MALDDIIATMRSTRTALPLAAPPSQPGVYALFLVKDARLGQAPAAPESVAYVGISSNLARRAMRQHFHTGSSGSSTLRRSLGAVLKDVLGLRAVHRSTGKSARDYTNYCFTADGEVRLTAWMHENLEISFHPTPDYVTLEMLLVHHLAPVLNIEHSANPYTATLKHLRTVCANEARQQKNLGLL